MPQWKDEIDEHIAFVTLDTLHSSVETLSAFADKQSNDLLIRLRLILNKGIKILVGADRAFLSTTTLDSMEANLVQVASNFNEVKSHADTPSLVKTYFTQMEPYLGQFIMSLGQIRAVSSPLSKNSAFEKLGYLKLDSMAQANRIRSAFQKEVDEIEESFTEIKDAVSLLSTSVAEEKQRADSLITQFQAEFNSGQKERDSQFRKKLEKEFSEKIEVTLNGVKSEFINLQLKAEAKIDVFDKNAGDLMEILEGHIKKAGLVAQSIAQKGLKTEYEKEAVTEKKNATKWSNITLGLSVVMILFVAGVLIKTLFDEKPISTETVVPKVLLTAILIGVARWSAKLEKRHADEAGRYKYLSLELETISPFIATLPEEDQQLITKNLVSRYFVGRTTVAAPITANDADAFRHPVTSVTDAIKQIYGGKESEGD